MARHFDASAPDFENRFAEFMAEPRGTDDNLAEKVREIINAVKQ